MLISFLLLLPTCLVSRTLSVLVGLVARALNGLTMGSFELEPGWRRWPLGWSWWVRLRWAGVCFLLIQSLCYTSCVAFWSMQRPTSVLVETMSALRPHTRLSTSAILLKSTQSKVQSHLRRTSSRSCFEDATSVSDGLQDFRIVHLLHVCNKGQ